MKKKEILIFIISLAPQLFFAQNTLPIDKDRFYCIGIYEYIDDSSNLRRDAYFSDIYGKVSSKGYTWGDHNQRLIAEERDVWYIYSTDGSRIGPYDEILPTEHNIALFSTNNMWGILDINGRIIAKPTYKHIEHSYDSGIDIFGGVRNGKTDIMNNGGKLLYTLDYEVDWFSDLHNYTIRAIIENQNGQEIVIFDAKTGKTIVPKGYKAEIHSCNKNGVIAAEDNNGKYGIFNRRGELIVPCKYDGCDCEGNDSSYIIEMYNLRDGYAIDKQLYNSNGKLIAENFDRVGLVAWGCDIFFIKKDSKWYAADIITGKEKYQVHDSVLMVVIDNYNHPELIDGRYLIVQTNSIVTDWFGKEYQPHSGVVDLATQKYVIPLWRGEMYIKEKGDYLFFYQRERNKDPLKLLQIIKFHANQQEIWLTKAKDAEILSWDIYKNDYYGENEYKGLSNKSTKALDLIVIEHMDGYGSVIDINNNTVLNSCMCTERDGGVCGNIHRTKLFILDEMSGVYDLKGNQLLSGKFHSIESGYDETCIVLGQGDKFLAYVYEDGKLNRVNDVESIYELEFKVLKERLSKEKKDVDKNIPSTKQKKNNTYAFIIANEKYSSAMNVPYAVNDGRIFKQYCQYTLGIDSNHIVLLENATAGQMFSLIEEIKQTVAAKKDTSSIIFYYAGHAFPDEESKYAWLLPVDGNINLKRTCYSLQDLYKDLNDVNASSVVCFIDACFSGSTREDQMLLKGRGVAIKVKDNIPQGSVVVFTSSTGNETAHQYAEKSHGMFTYFLLKKLQDSKGKVSLGELSDYIIDNVKKTSFEENKKTQTPTVIPSPKLQSTWRDIKL